MASVDGENLEKSAIYRGIDHGFFSNIIKSVMELREKEGDPETLSVYELSLSLKRENEVLLTAIVKTRDKAEVLDTAASVAARAFMLAVRYAENPHDFRRPDE